MVSTLSTVLTTRLSQNCSTRPINNQLWTEGASVMFIHSTTDWFQELQAIALKSEKSEHPAEWSAEEKTRVPLSEYWNVKLMTPADLCQVNKKQTLKICYGWWSIDPQSYSETRCSPPWENLADRLPASFSSPTTFFSLHACHYFMYECLVVFSVSNLPPCQKDMLMFLHWTGGKRSSEFTRFQLPNPNLSRHSSKLSPLGSGGLSDTPSVFKHMVKHKSSLEEYVLYF